MITLDHISELSQITEPCHWAMGVFDGVHLGHRAVILSAKHAAQKHGGLTAVLSFKKHPLTYICPEKAPLHILADEREKQTIMKELGVDVFLNLEFDETISTLSATLFIDLLANVSHIASISVGTDWKFGRKRQGDISFLQGEGETHGFSVFAIEPVTCNGERISSTAIRQLISEGALAEASKMLGRPYTLSGTVIHGKQLARQIGYPTANISIANEQTPPYGVYAIRATTEDGTSYTGMANLGLRPTILCDTHELLLEVHLFGFHESLYGQHLNVECVQFIRPEQTFPSLSSLQHQIEEDYRKITHLFQKN